MPQRCVPSKVQEGQVQSQLPRDMEAAFLTMGSPACSALHPQRAPPFSGVTRRKCGPWLSQYRGEKGTGPPQEKTHKGPGGNITRQVIGSLGGGGGRFKLSIRPGLGENMSLPVRVALSRCWVFLPFATSRGAKTGLAFLSLYTEGCTLRPAPPPPAEVCPAPARFLTHSTEDRVSGGHPLLHQVARWLAPEARYPQACMCPSSYFTHIPGTCLPPLNFLVAVSLSSL